MDYLEQVIPDVQIAVQPFAEPVSLAEIRLQTKQDEITTDDTLLASLLPVARNIVEVGTGANCLRNRVMMATTFDCFYNCFPACDTIQLPKVPLVSVVSITYVDNDGATQTLATSVYTVDTANGRVFLSYQQVWPSTRSIYRAVTVQIIAGLAASFTADAATDTLTVKGRTFTNGDRVRLMNSGSALPRPFSAKTDYFVIGASGSTFQLALTSGGSAIDITDSDISNGGINYVGSDLTAFETLRNAVKMAAEFLYRKPDGAMPVAVEALINAEHA